jgi:hypothetical protein
MLVLALAGLAASVAGLVMQIMPRTFSAAQDQQIVAWEMGKRWRAWPAGEIFSERIPYRVTSSVLGSPGDLILTAHRIGIKDQARCQKATDPAVAAILVRQRCLAVLRATYDDATQSLAVTVGVAVLPSPGAASAAARALPRAKGGILPPSVRAVAFANTLVARFHDRQRQLSWHRAAGPYLVFATVGYADGRRQVHEAGNTYAAGEMLSLAGGIGGWVASHLGAVPPPPRCPGGPAC